MAKKRGRPKKKAPLRKDLMMEIRKNMEEVNKRVQVIKKDQKDRGRKESDFVNTQYDKFRALTDTKSKNRIATGNLSRINKKGLNDILHQQRLFLNSKRSTLEGRAEIEAKSRDTFRKKGYDFNDKEWELMTDMMSDDAVSQLKQSRLLTSDQIVDIVADNDPEKMKNFSNALKTMKDELKVHEMESHEVEDMLVKISSGDMIEDKDGNLQLAYTKDPTWIKYSIR